MTFAIKIRGSASGPVLADFRCELHGVFEAAVPRDASDFTSCPTCGLVSPWTPSPIFGRVQEVSATQGKSAAKPHRMSMSTRDLAEGMPYNEWKKQRRKMWRDYDYKRRKDNA